MRPSENTDSAQPKFRLQLSDGLCPAAGNACVAARHTLHGFGGRK
ncbi:hypothetical protein [Kingella potus]|nr:hypothetical protein [Kingella potus]